MKDIENPDVFLLSPRDLRWPLVPSTSLRGAPCSCPGLCAIPSRTLDGSSCQPCTLTLGLLGAEAWTRYPQCSLSDPPPRLGLCESEILLHSGMKSLTGQKMTLRVTLDILVKQACLWNN